MPARMLRRLTAPLLALAVVFLAPVSAAAATGSPDAAAIIVTAHRGASGYAPENTLASGDAAKKIDTPWVEIDVQRSKDGELVIMHDRTLERTTDAEELYPDRAPWNVGDFTAEELDRLDAGTWFGPEFAGEPVPTLAEYVDLLEGNDANLLLELKLPELYPGIEAEIVYELRAMGWLDKVHLKERLVFQSFNGDSMQTMHKLVPRATIGYLGNPAVADMPQIAEYADQINPNHRQITKEYVDAIHALTGPHEQPLEAHTYTINDAATAKTIAAMGVDGIISNFPDVVRDAVGGA